VKEVEKKKKRINLMERDVKKADHKKSVVLFSRYSTARCSLVTALR
jgi:hypothetical protein